MFLNNQIKIIFKKIVVSHVAEFGDYDVEKHTPQYLKEFALIPKVLFNFNCLLISYITVFCLFCVF